jgi:hypothetical protein
MMYSTYRKHCKLPRSLFKGSLGYLGAIKGYVCYLKVTKGLFRVSKDLFKSHLGYLKVI